MAETIDDVSEIIADELDEGSQVERIARWHYLLLQGVAVFIARWGCFPDRDEVRRIGEIATEIEQGDDNLNPVH
jgi:hypothetical protein